MQGCKADSKRKRWLQKCAPCCIFEHHQCCSVMFWMDRCYPHSMSQVNEKPIIAATKSNAETTNCSTKHVLSSKIYWTETIIVALNKAENLLENSSTTCARGKKKLNSSSRLGNWRSSASYCSNDYHHLHTSTVCLMKSNQCWHNWVLRVWCVCVCRQTQADRQTDRQLPASQGEGERERVEKVLRLESISIIMAAPVPV